LLLEVALRVPGGCVMAAGEKTFCECCCGYSSKKKPAEDEGGVYEPIPTAAKPP